MARKAKTPSARNKRSAKAKLLRKVGPEPPKNLDDLQPIEAPHFFVSQIYSQTGGTDITLLFARGKPVATPGKEVVAQNVALAEIVGIATMSPQTAKDLAALMNDLIAKYEEEFGKLDTPYLRRRAKNAQSTKGR